MEINYLPYTITDKMLNLATSIMEKIGEHKNIQEVKNAYKAYEEIDNINPYSADD